MGNFLEEIAKKLSITSRCISDWDFKINANKAQNAHFDRKFLMVNSLNTNSSVFNRWNLKRFENLCSFWLFRKIQIKLAFFSYHSFNMAMPSLWSGKSRLLYEKSFSLKRASLCYSNFLYIFFMFSLHSDQVHGIHWNTIYQLALFVWHCKIHIQ